MEGVAKERVLDKRSFPAEVALPIRPSTLCAFPVIQAQSLIYQADHDRKTEGVPSPWSRSALRYFSKFGNPCALRRSFEVQPSAMVIFRPR